MTEKNKTYTYLILVSIFLFISIFIAGCQPSDNTPLQDLETERSPTQATSPSNSPRVTTDSSPTPQVFLTETLEGSTPDPAAIQVAWQASPHANTFVLDENGQNNTCARCHAPINWLPTMNDLPESCFACKFELEVPPPTIAKSEWTNIPCKICHKVDKKGNVLPEYAWLEIAPLDEYAPVASTTELCLKCHTPVDIPKHGTIQLIGAHSGYDCTQCHPAHQTIASCNPAGCHPSLDTSPNAIPGHDQDHQSVSCVACHDGSGMEVGLDEVTGIWTTFLLNTGSGGTDRYAFTSHNIVRESACDRCHYANNPWGLSEIAKKP